MHVKIKWLLRKRSLSHTGIVVLSSIPRSSHSCRESSERCLVLKNLPSNVQENDIYKLCKEFAEVEVRINRAVDSVTATVTVASEEDQEVLLDVLNKSKVGDRSISAIPDEVFDIGESSI